LVAMVLGLAVLGCGKKETPAGSVSLELVKEIEGFSVPECFIADKATGDIYVSNIVTDDEGYWVDDNNGFISRLDGEGNIKELKWLASTDAMAIHAPKGMTILGGYLYFADNAELKRVLLSDKSKVEVIELGETENLNDLANDGVSVWVTDTAKGKAFKVETDGSFKEIPGPEKINGITCWKGKIFAVSWDLHEVYELDPAGVKEPVAFGLAENFVNLDCIEVLEDGTFIVSDFIGNKIAAISSDRKTVTPLAEAESAADFYIDREKGLLYQPMVLTSKAGVYKIVQN
jgi:hypothetical protein